MKIFLIIVSVLLVLALGAVGYVWLKLQAATQSQASNTEIVVPEIFVESEETPVANEIPQAGLLIDTSSISEEQKSVAKKVGIDLDSMIITPQMVSCAEKKLGSLRLQEIVDGSNPSTLETLTLAGCL